MQQHAHLTLMTRDTSGNGFQENAGLQKKNRLGSFFKIQQTIQVDEINRQENITDQNSANHTPWFQSLE
jgi:hypothetical protein